MRGRHAAAGSAALPSLRDGSPRVGRRSTRALREPGVMHPPDFFPAAALLIDSGRRSLDAQPLHATPSRVEWNALPDAAERHGMTAWVHVAVRNSSDAPPEVRAAIEARARA